MVVARSGCRHLGARQRVANQSAMAATILGRKRRAWMVRVYEPVPKLDLQDIDPQEADRIVEALYLGQGRVMQETEWANSLESELGGVKLPEPVLIAGSIQSRIVRSRKLRDRASTRVDRGVIRIEWGIAFGPYGAAQLKDPAFSASPPM